LKIGIGLPTFLGNLVPARTILDWARAGDDAGFHALAVHDKPNHDTWEPLATLAMVGPITHRIRLATTALLLPTRDEALVAKQAAMVDQVSDGRLDLGVAVGGRPDDFELFGRDFRTRGRTFERQLERLIALWAAARATRDSGTAMGPVSCRDPHPRLFVGGYAPAAIQRAARWGDGFVFGAPGAELMATRIPAIRAAAASAGKTEFPIQGLVYVLPSEDPVVLAEGERLLLRYYGTLRKPFLDLVAHGSGESIMATVRAHEAAGLDVLHLLPVTADIGAVDRLADQVLLHYLD